VNGKPALIYMGNSKGGDKKRERHLAAPVKKGAAEAAPCYRAGVKMIDLHRLFGK